MKRRHHWPEFSWKDAVRFVLLVMFVLLVVETSRLIGIQARACIGHTCAELRTGPAVQGDMPVITRPQPPTIYEV